MDHVSMLIFDAGRRNWLRAELFREGKQGIIDVPIYCRQAIPDVSQRALEEMHSEYVEFPV